jgi:hypothetical protein
MYTSIANKFLKGIITCTLLILLGLMAMSAWEIFSEQHLELPDYDYVSITQQLLC